MKVQRNLSILYVDDDEDAREMMTLLLEQSGIKVTSAESIEEACEIAQSESFDLFLMDSQFPTGNGLDLCLHLRERAPQTPVIFYSGNGMMDDKLKGIAAGAAAYLVKPEFEDLFQAIIENTMKTEIYSQTITV